MRLCIVYARDRQLFVVSQSETVKATFVHNEQIVAIPATAPDPELGGHVLACLDASRQGIAQSRRWSRSPALVKLLRLANSRSAKAFLAGSRSVLVAQDAPGEGLRIMLLHDLTPTSQGYSGDLQVLLGDLDERVVGRTVRDALAHATPARRRGGQPG